MRHFLSLTMFKLLLAMPTMLWADAQLPLPEGQVILSVTGKLSHTNVGEAAHFDAEMLKALGMHTVATHTPWTEGVSQFSGPLGRDLLEAVGASGDTLIIKALNDYVAEIPVSDFIAHDVILAIMRNGERLTVRDFGPIFILYPFDEDPALQTEKIRFRSVWQVASIEIQ
ncbi:molybdopterin-dependent oxidoreductase [Halomonas sp. HP20-15]|uniref:molybdopterin-dependent oxidoreductase n=1 Tax=Halomonas sp. HP20-15 TaxID=3085901 RepID=UPI00298121B1|nr:molybdopterin-dependent oxidoreductase [Halomonas sp. HP20-15]MDW5377876.1 molybdopterin-dependent oxidoreductase [Halomonas sp. HP20-15]